MNAKKYIEHWEKNKVWTHLKWPKHQNRFKTIASFLKGETFIDIGCAYGHSTYWLKKFRDGKWAGLDFSKKAIKIAKEYFKEMNFFYLENIENLKGFMQFDGVVCSEVIEHVEDDVSLVEGLLGITKKILVITTPCVKIDDPGHLRLYTEEMLHNLFKETNHKVYKRRPFWYVVVRKDE
ncbi:MAG TPA: class I SAM-dependent methyltransferase [Acidobacteriota bacterium]|nr:class I SAM-dependent methyltransferase [Acidobacteriota bacterium]